MTLRAIGAEPRATGWRDNKEGQARASTAGRRDAFFLSSWKTPYRLWVLNAKKETLRLRVANRRLDQQEILSQGVRLFCTRTKGKLSIKSALRDPGSMPNQGLNSPRGPHRNAPPESWQRRKHSPQSRPVR